MHNIDENKVLRDALSSLNEDVPPMPEGLHAAWMQKVEEDMDPKRTTRSVNMPAITRFLAIAAALVFVVGGTLLTRDDLANRAALEADYAALVAQNDTAFFAATPSAEYGAKLAVYDDAFVTEDAVVFTNGTADAGGGTQTITLTGKRSRSIPESDLTPTAEEAPVEKKIIRTANLTIRTQEYDLSLSALRARCEAEGGWIESSSEWIGTNGLRSAHLQLRIPQTALDAFLAGSAEHGRITNRSETAIDVTASYQDTQARLNTQLALMERLQALIPESASLADLLALEAQIADTQYQIDTLTSSLAETDRQVTYSTVSISLSEETAPELTDTTVSLGDRLLAGLRLGATVVTDFAQDMLVFLVAALPFIGIVAVVVIVAVVIRRIRRRNAK